MRKIRKIKKKNIVLLFLFFLFCCIFLIPKSYEKEYRLNQVQIKENFYEKDNVYTFTYQYDDKEFLSVIPHKKIHAKKLIQSIEIKNEDQLLCLLPKSKKIELAPLCYQEGEYISYHLIDKEGFLPNEYSTLKVEEERTYESIKYYSLLNKKYFIWHYNEFYVIDSTGGKTIPVFQEDVYNIPLAMQMGKYLILANYDEKYLFHKFYIFDSEKKNKKEIPLEKDISFESSFLGNYKNKVYFLDKKNKIEYEINPKKLKIEVIAKQNKGKIIKDGKWETMSMNSLVNNDIVFTSEQYIHYELENNILYANLNTYKMKVSNKKIKDMIYQEKTAVYYLVDDQLYYFDPIRGEVLLLSNFEWNFNYKNTIFIFD